MEPANNEENIILIDHKIDVPKNKLTGGTNRNPVFSIYEGLIIYKPESEQELNNYKIVNKYRQKLQERGVCFPVLLQTKDLNSVPGYFAQISLPFFQPFTIEEHFGKFGLFEEKKVLEAYIKGIRTIGEVIPQYEFESHEEEGVDQTLAMVNTFREYVEDYTKTITPYINFSKIIKDNLISVEGLQLDVSHKDANPSNWRAVTINDKLFINFIDLETLGLAHPGWDEGRTYVLFAMNPERQKLFLELLKEEPAFQDKNILTNFWLVVMLRSLREIYFLKRGKYDESIENYKSIDSERNELKESIISAVGETLKQALKELRKDN